MGRLGGTLSIHPVSPVIRMSLIAGTNSWGAKSSAGVYTLR